MKRIPPYDLNKKDYTFLEVSSIMAAVSTQPAPGIHSGLGGSAHAQAKPDKHDVAYDMMYFALEGTPAPFHMG